MKKLILLVIIAALFSINNFAQYNFPAFKFDKQSGDYSDKMINMDTKYADYLSNKKSPILNIILNRIAEENGNYSKTSELINQYRDIVYFSADVQNNITIPVFIRTNSVESTRNKIAELGGYTGTIAGDIITANLPASSINLLVESPEVIYVDASTVSKTKLDVSRVETKVKQLHDGTGISRPYKGNGVVVGVMDSGIDWKHADFKNSGGSRINYLWDMSGSGNPPSGYGYGREYTKAQIDANQCQEVDGNDGGGHGTHVSGTAAGSGGANSNYIGMAPESDIVFVKGFRNGPGFASTDVVDGCNYIFQKAQQLSKPAVINLSLGGHFGPHDGTSLYEQGLSNLTGNGKIIVAAAGNEGGNTIHLSYPVTGSSYNNSYETFFELYNNASAVYSDFWYNSGSISVGIAAYDGSLNLIGYTNPVPPGQKIENLAFTVQNVTYGFVTIDATGTSNPQNGGNEVVIIINSNNGQVNISNVFWSLYTTGSGTFDAWAFGEGYFSTYTGGQSYIKPGDNQKTIGMPSTAGKVICVGSYVTKTQWVDYNGVTQNQPGNPVIGQISSFSSIGPSRDGRIKPDICAPGEVIVAAYSSFLTQTPQTNIIQGGLHQKMQGTSMASPHVTGAVALLLEKNGTLDYNQVVAILKDNAKHDSFTGTTPNNTYGSGKLDAYNSFLNTSGGGGGTQTTIIQEGFDAAFPPSGWTKQTLNSNNTWTQSNPQNNNFNQIVPSSLYSAICPWVAENQNEWLITPAFNLGSGNASLEFYVAHSTQYLTGATIKLNISTNGGTDWQKIWEAENDGQGFKWRLKTFDLSAYSNKQNLKLAWQYVGNDGDLVGVDGVKLVGYTSTDVESEESTVTEFALAQNYPNPFNPSTKIKYSIPEVSKVNLTIFNLLGEKVATLVNEVKSAGSYIVDFNASNLASGVYLYKLQAGSFMQTHKMLLLK